MATEPLTAGPIEGERLRVEILACAADFVRANAPVTTAAPETRDAVVRRVVADLVDVFAIAPAEAWADAEQQARILLTIPLREAGLGGTMSTLIVSAKAGALRQLRAPESLAHVTDGAAALPALAEYVDAIARGHEADNAVPTGLSTVDDVLNGGLPRGEITLLLASTGGGKTALAQQLADEASRHDRGLVYVCSPEMQGRDLWFRNAQRRAGVSRRDLRPGSGSARQAAAVAAILGAASRQSERSNLVLLDRTDADVALAIEAARALHHSARGPLYMCVLDYAQQLAPQSDKTPRYLAVASVATDALKLATETGAAVLITSQVNSVRSKTGDVIDVTVRESQVLEHKASVSILLVPDRAARTAKLSLRKNRHGPTPQALELAYAPELFRFAEPE